MHCTTPHGRSTAFQGCMTCQLPPTAHTSNSSEPSPKLSGKWKQKAFIAELLCDHIPNHNFPASPSFKGSSTAEYLRAPFRSVPGGQVQCLRDASTSARIAILDEVQYSTTVWSRLWTTATPFTTIPGACHVCLAFFALLTGPLRSLTHPLLDLFLDRTTSLMGIVC